VADGPTTLFRTAAEVGAGNRRFADRDELDSANRRRVAHSDVGCQNEALFEKLNLPTNDNPLIPAVSMTAKPVAMRAQETTSSQKTSFELHAIRISLMSHVVESTLRSSDQSQMPAWTGFRSARSG